METDLWGRLVGRQNDLNLPLYQFWQYLLSVFDLCLVCPVTNSAVLVLCKHQVLCRTRCTNIGTVNFAYDHVLPLHCKVFVLGVCLSFFDMSVYVINPRSAAQTSPHRISLIFLHVTMVGTCFTIPCNGSSHNSPVDRGNIFLPGIGMWCHISVRFSWIQLLWHCAAQDNAVHLYVA